MSKLCRRVIGNCRDFFFALSMFEIIIFLVVVGWLGLFPSKTFATNAFGASSFVTIHDGHLVRDGKRLRVWGVNIQSGVFKSYEEIDDVLDRINALGFNAIRIWPTSDTFYSTVLGKGVRFNASTQGDSSNLDRFDYLVAGASRRGINIQMTMLHYLDLPTLRASVEPEVAEVVSSASDEPTLRLLHGIAPYVSEGYRNRLKRHMRWVLARKNPYTGRTYANEPAISTWELANESHFVHCAIKPACLSKLPPTFIALLNKAWLESARNSSQKPLPAPIEKILEPNFYDNYGRFIVDQFISVSQELKDFARSVGGINSGIEKQPFIFNTAPEERGALAHFAYSSGDVYSASAYSGPMSKMALQTNGTGASYVGGARPIPFLEYIKVKDKPFIMYEGSFFRPYEFRSEWGLVIAAIALKQDWDGAFLYTYGQPTTIYELDRQKARYGNKPLPIPVRGDKGDRGHYSFGFHHGGDPIAMASWSVGGRLFLGAPAIASEPDVLWDVPLDGVFKPGAGYPPSFLTPLNSIETPRKKSVAVRFVNASPVCSPCVRSNQKPNDVFIQWDAAASRLTIKTPTGEAVAGALSGRLGVLWGGVTAEVGPSGFGVVAITRALGEQVDRLQVIGNSENTGYTFDRSKVSFSGPAGVMDGVLNRGAAPLVYSGPAVSFVFPSNAESYTEFDFNFVKAAPVAVGGAFAYTPSDRVFGINVNYREKVLP